MATLTNDTTLATLTLTRQPSLLDAVVSWFRRPAAVVEPMSLDEYLNFSLANGSLPKCGHTSFTKETDGQGYTWKWCTRCGAVYNPYTGQWEE